MSNLIFTQNFSLEVTQLDTEDEEKKRQNMKASFTSCNNCKRKYKENLKQSVLQNIQKGIKWQHFVNVENKSKSFQIFPQKSYYCVAISVTNVTRITGKLKSSSKSCKKCDKY